MTGNFWKLLLLFFAFHVSLQVEAQNSEVPETTISLKAVAGLKFDQLRFRVKPGSKVKIIFTNNDDMSHNLLFTQPGAREEIVDAALQMGEAGPKKNFVPDNSKVLWHIPVIVPGKTASITFNAPEEPGVFPYVCTYPGHGYVMFGAMYVTNEAMPNAKNDPNIPQNNKGGSINEGAHHMQKISGHPYDPVPPFLYRILLPDASPAAIAVSLPHNLSFCWDAGTCRLRYAWQGEFLDPTKYWEVKGERFARISGTVFYRDKTKYPLRLIEPDAIPAVKFKGYRFIDRYPEFRYTINGIDVYELIHPKPDGTGLVRNFRIPESKNPIWFVFDQEDGVNYACSKGEWINGRLKLSPGEAQQFTITMTKKEEAGL